MKSVKEYIDKVIAHLTSHFDIELEPLVEYEIIRVLIELAEEKE